MLAWVLVIAVGGALAGFQLAYRLGAATSAAMSIFYGLLFALVLLITQWRQRTQAEKIGWRACPASNTSSPSCPPAPPSR